MNELRVVRIKRMDGLLIHTFWNREAYFSDAYYKKWIDDHYFNFIEVIKEHGDLIYVVT